MKQLFQKYKQSVFFVLKFFGIYIAGSTGYYFYLRNYQDVLDPFSRILAKNVAWLLSFFKTQINLRDHPFNPGVYIYQNDFPASYIIEGCNAISIMILFLAFIFAFRASAKAYLWFAPIGLAIIYVSNVIRIVFMATIRMHFSEAYHQAFHDYIFPAWIYGTVFLLWVIWVKKIVR